MKRAPDGHTVTVVDDPEPASLLELETGLVRFNATRSEPENYAPLAVFVHDEEGRQVGGASGFTHWNWLFIELFWVDQDHSGLGLGSRVLAELERRAVERGARSARVCSYSFQSPGFYEHHGYMRFGVLDDYPSGSSLIFLHKQLGSGGGP